MQFGISQCVSTWGRYRPNDVAIIANGVPITYHSVNQSIDDIQSTLLCDISRGHQSGL